MSKPPDDTAQPPAAPADGAVQATTTPLNETPEFKAAVADYIAAMKNEILGELNKTLASASPKQESGSMEMARAIALSMAEVADQGTNRKRVAPEILEARSVAEKKMGALILAARKLPRDQQPRYRVMNKIQLKERVIEPYQRLADKRIVPNEITWTGVPNAAMRPMNATATEIFDQFKGWLGGAVDLATAERPLWVTDGGLILAGAPTASASAHGLTMVPEVHAADENDPDDLSVMSQDDPRIPEVHILGTIHPPAKRVADNSQAA